jgi:O-antigen ligase
LLFRGLGIIVLSIFSYLVLSGQSFYWARLKQKLSWTPALLLFTTYTTSLLGDNFYRGFWSTFERGDGLLTLTIAVIFFYLTLLYADQQFFSKLLKTIAWVGTIVAIHASLQWLQVQNGINIPFIAEPTGRLGGTFGNAAYLASYLGLTAFITFSVARSSFGRMRRVLYMSGVLQLLVVFLTATRGTMLALLITGIIALIYFSFAKSNLKKYAQGMLLLLVLSSSLFFVFRETLSNSSFEPIERIASISLKEGAIANRLFVWQAVLKASLNQPIKGYGAEQIEPIFNKAYDPSLISEHWFDRSHNVFLDYFVQYGIFGLIFYLLLISTLLFSSWKILQSGDKRGMYLVGMTFVYGIQNFFVFDTSATLWILFVFTGVILAISNPETSSVLLKKQIPVLSKGITLIILLFLLPVVITPLHANNLLMKGYLDHMVDVPSSVENMRRGLALNTYADLEYGYQAYAMYTERQVSLLSGNDRVLAYQYALETLTKNFQRYANDARTATYLAHVIDLTPPEVKIDSELLKQILDEALELSPKRMQLWLLRANISLREADTFSSRKDKLESYKKATLIIEKYIELVPKSTEAMYILANLYLKNIKDGETASLWAEKGFALYSGNREAAHQAFKYYIAIEDWTKALLFLKDIINEDDEDNYEFRYDLAKLYYLTGDTDKSVEAFEEVKENSPEILETDPAFLQVIESIISENNI